jgi:hypothetical protein
VELNRLFSSQDSILLDKQQDMIISLLPAGANVRARARLHACVRVVRCCRARLPVVVQRSRRALERMWMGYRCKPRPQPIGVVRRGQRGLPRRHDFRALFAALSTAPCGSAAVPQGLGSGSPRPHLRRDWAHPAHICAGTGPTPLTFAPGLGSGSPRPHLRRDWAHPAQCRRTAPVGGTSIGERMLLRSTRGVARRMCVYLFRSCCCVV